MPECAGVTTSSGGVFDLDALRARLKDLEEQSSDPSLWEDRERAEKLLRVKRGAERKLALFEQTFGLKVHLRWGAASNGGALETKQ